MVLQFCKFALLVLVLGAGSRLFCYLIAGGRRPTPSPQEFPPCRPSRSAAHPAKLAAPIPALMLGDFIYYIVAAAANKLPYKFCPKISVKFCLVW